MHTWNHYQLACTIFYRYGLWSNHTLTYKHKKYTVKPVYHKRILISNTIATFLSFIFFTYVLQTLTKHITKDLLLIIIFLLILLLCLILLPVWYYLLIPLQLDKLCEDERTL